LLDIDRVVKVGKLFSIYGELLTDKQQEFVQLYYYDDLSLGEIAEEKGISRQAVYDNLQRSEEMLKEYEEKLNMAAYFDCVQQEVDELKKLVETLRPRVESAELDRLQKIVSRLETYHEGELK
jgi:predicted DNA-binding protein YlxM (UPF0122 family)